MNIKIKVKGMVCHGCENRIKNALSQIEGVNKVNADHEKGIVTIKTKDNLDLNLIYEKINDLGFEVIND